MDEPYVLPTAPEHYRADIERVNDALTPYILTDEDGWQGIDPTAAPSGLLELYSRLAIMGYANSWLGIRATEPKDST